MNTWVLSTRRVDLLIIPDSLWLVLAQAKEDMKRNPQLTLPEDPNINIWNYYSIMKVTPIIMENFLLVILTIPLADQSLVMNLYKVHNLPALHPKLHVQFQYQLEGEYLAITKDKQYAPSPLLETYEYVKLLKDISAPWIKHSIQLIWQNAVCMHFTSKTQKE